MYEDSDDINPVDNDTLAEAYEEFLTLEVDEEFELGMDHLIWMITKFQEAHGREPTKLYVSDDNELQSVLMYSANTLGLEYDRTQKKTYLE